MSFVPYVYLLRFPLLTAILLVVLPIVALNTGASSLLRGLFDVDVPGPLLVTLGAFTTAWTVMVTAWLVLLYGSRRFKVRHLAIHFPPSKLFVFLFGLLALPIVAGMFVQSMREGRPAFWPLCGYSAVGLLVAILFLWVAAVLFRKFPVSRPIPLLSRLGPGYTRQSPTDRQSRSLLPGHVHALFSFFLSALLYIGVGWGKSLRFGSQPLVPTLAYVLLLLILLCWGLSALSFFFDRHRIPVILPLGLWWTVTSQFSQSDHYFRVLAREQSQYGSISPADAIRAGKRTSVVVVAANGGGIQSAAWTAKVLTELELKCRQAFPHDPRIFGESIRLISSVSGGSVGAMYFLNEYDSQTGALPDDTLKLKDVVRRAEASSLDDIAWGLVYPDLWRTLIPFFPWKYNGRGLALEAALTRESNKDGTDLSHGLSKWRHGVSTGSRPALVFNATVADTGDRLVLSTTDMKSKRGRKNFNALGWEGDAQYRDKDVAVVTAARLSATFPYVSPAARSDLPGKQFHVVDGGYYDNYGVTTLVEWLDEALSAPDNPIQRILVLQIRGARSEKQIELKNRRGWFYQTFAPIATMLHVRSAGQLSHNEAELDLLKRLWCSKNVVIQPVVFEFDLKDPPLSWHLTPGDKSAIRNAWEQQSDGTGWTIVKDFLAATKGPAPEPRCQAE